MTSRNRLWVVCGWGLVALVAILAFYGIPRREPFLLGGIQVNEPDHEVWAQGLKAAGMNTVSVTVYAHQGDWDTDHLWFDEENEAVVSEIRAAKSQGLKVVLILRVALDHAFERNLFLWHGMIQPKTPELLHSWFEQYTRFVVIWARIAEREGVDLVGVASEMNELTSTVSIETLPALHEYYLDEEKNDLYRQQAVEHAAASGERSSWREGNIEFSSLGDLLEARAEAHRSWARQVSWQNSDDPLGRMNRRRRRLEESWRRLIEATREVFSGSLTYAANFDQYELVKFWNELDVMGINAYFPIRSDPRLAVPSPQLEEALFQGWKGVLEGISRLRHEQGLGDQPVVFTELGYTFRVGCTLQPWASQGFSVIRWSESPATESGAAADGAAPGAPRSRFVVWGDAPLEPLERALALKGLRRAAQEVEPGMLQGLLYWKLSTLPGHREVEPFVLILGEEPPDPLEIELAYFIGLS